MRTDTPQTIRLKDYKPHPYVMRHVALDVRLDPQRTQVYTSLTMAPNPASEQPGGPLVLDGEAIELVSISIDDRTLDETHYCVDDDTLTIHHPPAGDFTLVMETTCNPDANTALSGLYRSSGVYCTQCEAEGFRRICYSIDRPDNLAVYRVRIEAGKADVPVLLANGNLVDHADMAGSDRHFAVWEDPFPKPSYLFALVAGDLACVEDSFTTMSGRDVALKIYVEHGKEDRCDWAMQSLKASMRWDEEAFGREYDLDIFMIVAVSDFNMGAMENKGLNVFNDKYILARPDTATDQDYANIEAIIAHEYFHNWTGNRITCRDWFQLCLKEGLTVFRDQEFTCDLRSRPVKRITDVRLLRSHQFPEDAGPLAHPVRPGSYIEINNFYTATVYEKGAEVVRMMKTLLGPEAFRKALDLYFDRHDGEAATVEDFVQCMADVSGRDMSQFFRWYEQAGTPAVTAAGEWNEADGTYSLTVQQEVPDTPGQTQKGPHLIPLGIGLVGVGGEDIALRSSSPGWDARGLIELTKATQSFVFDGVGERPVLSLNRGFSAPVRLSTGNDARDTLFLMAHDSDGFNRWEAGQTAARNLILDTMPALAANEALPSAEPLIEALRQVLQDQSLEPAFMSAMLTLPGETDLASHIGKNVDPGLVHEAREQVRSALGTGLKDQLAHAWSVNEVTGDYSPDAASAGCRALRFAALSLMAAADLETGAKMAFDLFSSAGNMTEKAAALAVLSAYDRPERDEALERFYADYEDDHLVVDKWFAFHAMRPLEDCADRVRGLMKHPAFKLTQPNRVRALVGTFAAANPVRFNAPDGSGYRLVADLIIELDPVNPQVAARTAAGFKSWRVLERRRRAAAEGELRRIEVVENLSRDTREIVTRCLS